MRVFVSWSGKRSHEAAQGLRSLLEETFPDVVDVFVSDHIDPGEAWARRLETELEQSEFGILCLTQENFEAPWLLFEAGAIAKKFGSERVAPYLIDDLPTAFERSPLAQFQRAQANREDTLFLVKTINKSSGNPQSIEKLEKRFNGWWRDFEQTLQTIRAQPTPEGRQPDGRSDRVVLETILQKVENLAQSDRNAAGSEPRLPSEELAHLLNLLHQPSIMYSQRGNLLRELRHLRDLGFIKNKQGPIAQLPQTFQLDHYFELLEHGRKHVQQIEGPAKK